MTITTESYDAGSFNTTSHALILPLIGNTGINPRRARPEFLSMEPIIGSTFRHALRCEPEGLGSKANAESLIEKIATAVNTDCEADLKAVLRDSYFDAERGIVRRFCKESLLCLTHAATTHKKNTSSLDALGEYFSRVFITDVERGHLESVGRGELHLLDQEMQSALQVHSTSPPHSDVPVRRYFEDELVSSFRRDIRSLSRDSATLLGHVDSLVRLYLFHYVTEVIRHLSATRRSLTNAAEHEQVRGLFYILEGERSSASRISVTNGWSSVRGVFAEVFTHINCLEVLNHVRLSGHAVLDYADIVSHDSPAMLDAVKQVARDFVATASEWRKGAFSNGQKLLGGVESASDSSMAVSELWKWIDFEIKNSGRDRIWTVVGKWFEEFAYGSLLQQRGRVGYIAVLPLRYLHLLVFLAVKESEQERIRLKDFWFALHRRGIRFDETTKRAVVTNLESIGVLETRSDSGDARYVRSPF